MSGVELGTFNEVKKLAKRPPAYDMATHAATGFCKPSIILFDTRPGTRSFTIPQGVTRIRAFVVGAGGDGAKAGTNGNAGAGGGYSEKEYAVSGGDFFTYTVGASPSGTSSFNSEISATGGETPPNSNAVAVNGGVGSGGDINTSGGSNTSNTDARGGASSGNRFSDGLGGIRFGGFGWSGIYTSGNLNTGGAGEFDGFGLGILPGRERPNSSYYTDGSDYGCGGQNGGGQGGIGGGGGSSNSLNSPGNGGIGGGGGANGSGGLGLVGIEVLEVE